MNNDTITLAGFDWTPFIIWAGLATLLWLLLTIFLIVMDVRSKSSYSLWGLFGFIIGFIGMLILLGIWVGWGGSLATDWDNQQRVNALGAQGYEDVLLTDSFAADGWTGSYEQEYKRGIFVQVEGETWTIEVLSSGDQ